MSRQNILGGAENTVVLDGWCFGGVIEAAANTQ